MRVGRHFANPGNGRISGIWGLGITWPPMQGGICAIFSPIRHQFQYKRFAYIAAQEPQFIFSAKNQRARATANILDTFPVCQGLSGKTHKDDAELNNWVEKPVKIVKTIEVEPKKGCFAHSWLEDH